MYNISVIYPPKEGYHFDFDYYLNTHMPRSIELLSVAPGFHRISVEQGVSIETPELKSSFVAMCHFYFDSPEAFMTAFMPHAQELQSDIPNYTNIEPVIQINKVVLTNP